MSDVEYLVVIGAIIGNLITIIALGMIFLGSKAIAHFRRKAKLRRIDKRVSETYSWY